MMARFKWYLDPLSPKKKQKKMPKKNFRVAELDPSDKTFWIRACKRRMKVFYFITLIIELRCFGCCKCIRVKTVVILF